MTIRMFTLNLDETTYQIALAKAQQKGKSLELVLGELLTAYIQGKAKSGMRTYTVQRGDSLAKIARQFYGDPYKYKIIQEANQLTNAGQIWVGQVLIIPDVAGSVADSSSPRPVPVRPSSSIKSPPTPSTVPPPSTFAPPSASSTTEPVQVNPCAPIPEERYGTLSISGRPTDRPAAQHGDINLALRGYSPTQGTANLINMSGPTDTNAPQLAGLFGDNKRKPVFTNLYRANHWDWGSNSPGGAITDFKVTVAGLQVGAGEKIHLPYANYDIGQGYRAMVLYADSERITLKYTREDNVINGYTIHVEGICTEPTLLALYQQMNASGRANLPALRAGQAFGRARKNEIRVAIRDTGRFMDPRVRKDWWQGY